MLQIGPGELKEGDSANPQLRFLRLTSLRTHKIRVGDKW